MSKKVDVSVLMTVFNESKKELKESIESILNQTFKEFEFIIILDKPDNKLLKDIVELYEKRDSRIKFIVNKKNLGLAKSLNKGLTIAKGTFIARMDADDIADITRFEKQIQLFQKKPIVDIVSTNIRKINNDGNQVGGKIKLPKNQDKIKKILPLTSIIVHSSVMFKKNKIDRINGYRNFSSSQDYDLWLRCLDQNYNFEIIDEPLIEYRVRDNSITQKNPLKQYLISKYIRQLYKERKNREKDSFSEENLDLFLKKNKAFDEKEIERYKKGLVYSNNLKRYLKEKKLIKIIETIIKIIFCQKEMKGYLWINAKAFFLKRI